MEKSQNKIWFDFANPPHVNLFQPILDYFNSKEAFTQCTAKEFVETTGLLREKNIDFRLFGQHGGRSRVKKVSNLLKRVYDLTVNVSGFDVSISSNYEAPFVTWLKRKKSIVFDDNDISPNWLYSKFADYVICPEVIDKSAMIKMGVKPDRLLSYGGFKEDIYIASYIPDKKFLSSIPFNEYIVVRPENIKASYVPKGVHSIVPDLISSLIGVGKNILYLPRYQEDRSYAEQSDKVYIPDVPLNGLDVCYHAQAVLTGAGTFSREAALMGIPAVSFFAGDKFLSVDKYLINKESIFFSRNVDEIIKYLGTVNNGNIDLSRSMKVQREVFDILDRIIAGDL